LQTDADISELALGYRSVEYTLVGSEKARLVAHGTQGEVHNLLSVPCQNHHDFLAVGHQVGSLILLLVDKRVHTCHLRGVVSSHNDHKSRGVVAEADHSHEGSQDRMHHQAESNQPASHNDEEVAVVPSSDSRHNLEQSA